MKNDDLSCKTAVIPYAVVISANFQRYPLKIKNGFMARWDVIAEAFSQLPGKAKRLLKTLK